jgi:thiamine pyrophosphate-dependent acetolactate synthase large subunit-like protein
MRARRVDSVDELDGALQWSFAAEGPTLLDLRIEYAPHRH